MDLKIPVQLRIHLWNYWLDFEIPHSQRHQCLTLCVFMEMLQRVKSTPTTQHHFTIETEIKKQFDRIFTPSGVKMTIQRSGRPFREKKVRFVRWTRRITCAWGMGRHATPNGGLCVALLAEVSEDGVAGIAYHLRAQHLYVERRWGRPRPCKRGAKPDDA